MTLSTVQDAARDTAAVLQEAGAAFQDTAATHGIGFQDSVRVESPLPGGVAEVVRFFFHVPRWIQIGGVILGAAVALLLVVLLWRRRRRILGWLRTRSRPVGIGLAALALLVVVAAVGAGTVSWDYMQHDNGFCTGCHVMGPSFQAFTASEHADQLCHDCHQQSIFASARQLVMWVGERPDEIGSHAVIPDAICQTCHATGESEKWEHIEATAGHRVHFESDDPELADVSCLTCHAAEVHEFAPVDRTCAQAGCHEDMDVKLGGMANQTSLHCAACHEFTADVTALATTDSAASTLGPSFEGCTGSHEMQQVLLDFEPEREPHGARCGVCHNAHEQTAAADAAETCAECHDDWRDEPFHVGTVHQDAASQCVMCHEPHAARVDASDCAGCHGRVAADPETAPALRRRLRAAQPFDTAAALRQTRAPVPDRRTHEPSLETLSRLGPSPIHSIGTMASTADPARALAILLAVPADSFEHGKHEELTCITCHTTSEGHGDLTFEPPRGCQICHHQAPARTDCADCHPSGDALPGFTADVTVHPVPDSEPVHRTGDFAHEKHGDLACVECHRTPVTLSPPAEVATCASCHENHHEAGITCTGCHAVDPATEAAHAPPETAHEACAACHTTETIAALEPDRPFCLTCHQTEVDHEPAGLCATCHMLESPEEYRPRLIGDDRVGS
jgi:hypothetical protein